MKKLIFLLIAALFFVEFAAAQSAVIKNAFKKKFPGASDVTWVKSNATDWEAEFTLGQNYVTAFFKSDGTWLETEKKIRITDLPKNIADSIKAKYPDWTIVEAYKSESIDKGVLYETSIKKRMGRKDISYKEDGIAVAY